METLNLAVKWLSDNESALSAMAAIAVIAGILYGALRYVLTPLLRRANIDASHSNTQKIQTVDDAQAASLAGLKKTHSKSVDDRPYSIAVMLFESLSSDPDDEFIAAGITSEIIVHVTTVPTIRVSSRLSSYSYKSERNRDSLKGMAEELNSKFVLSGNLQRAGDRIQVTAQLTDIDSDTQIWARTYKRDIEDVFEVQHDIARCIVGTVLGEVKFAQTSFAEEIPSHQLDSWGLVQKAYHFWLTAFSIKGVEDASEYLKEAIAISPDYARAHAALAMLLAQRLISGTSTDYNQCKEDARQHIEKAYRLAPSDIEVLENAGVTWFHLGESRRATLALRSTVTIAPLNLIARGYLALVLAATGGEDGAKEAIEILEQNHKTAPKHPTSAYWHYFRALAEQRLGDHEKAIEYAMQSIAEQPGWLHSSLLVANSKAALGDREGAIMFLDSVKEVNPNLSAELYYQQLMIETVDEDNIKAFSGGLIKEGFIQAESEVQL